MSILQMHSNLCENMFIEWRLTINTLCERDAMIFCICQEHVTNQTICTLNLTITPKPFLQKPFPIAEPTFHCPVALPLRVVHQARLECNHQLRQPPTFSELG